MAEFLVHRTVPSSVFTYVATSGEPYADAVREALAKTGRAVRVAVRPTWYYGYERR